MEGQLVLCFVSPPTHTHTLQATTIWSHTSAQYWRFKRLRLLNLFLFGTHHLVLPPQKCHCCWSPGNTALNKPQNNYCTLYLYMDKFCLKTCGGKKPETIFYSCWVREVNGGGWGAQSSWAWGLILSAAKWKFFSTPPLLEENTLKQQRGKRWRGGGCDDHL